MKITHLPTPWFHQQVLAWYDQQGRHTLPWKKTINAYRVWVSEIMLQQTQVSTVIPYFKRFMKTFPNVKTLAKAPLDDVLHLWAGLGYYARGRNLHKTAQMIHEQYQDKFPSTVEALMELPGIGRSTAGAIVAQAFNLRAPICDGNVKRVLSRLHCIGGWPGQKEVEAILWELASHYTPFERVADYTQAMMDIGATLCTRSSPNCPACPLQERCQAYAEDKQHIYPQKKPQKTLPFRQTLMLCLLNKNKEILLQQRPQKGIWGGLWSLPQFDDKETLTAFIQQHFGLKRLMLSPLVEIQHTFTHFHLTITPWQGKISKSTALQTEDLHWVNAKALKKLGFPAPVKKLLQYDMIAENM